MTTPDRTDGDGLRLVPIEPTPDMQIAGGIAWSEALKDAETYVDCADACYKAMIRTAPQAPDTGEGTEPVAWRVRLADGGCTSWFDGKPPNYWGPFEFAYAAPPKPASDALREALDWLINCVECEVNVPRTTTVFQLRLAKAKEALASSAPVQSGAVRGDREAIMALIEKHVGVTMDLTEGEGVLLGVGNAADAILSLQSTGDQPTPQVNGEPHHG